MLKLSESGLTDKFALIAKTKSGKSYLGKIIQKAKVRKIIIDRVGEYDSSFGEIVTGFDQFCEAVKRVWDLPDFSIIFRFEFGSTMKDEVFEQICFLCLQMRDVFLVCEEIHLYTTTQKMNPYLEEIATCGSHYGIGYLLTTQRPNLIHKTLLTQCDHIFIGSLIDMNDIRYIREFTGELSHKVNQYPARHFIHWHLGQIAEINTENLSFIS